MSTTLFISDLHLDPDRPAITRLFLDFLDTRGQASEKVYILGDLFEAWIGDDDDMPMNQAVRNGLKNCTASGTSVFIMHGNRDFLLGRGFADQSGCTLLQEPTRIDLYAVPTLLMHGDSLCTADTEYLAFREQVREPEWQKNFLGKSLEERRTEANRMRAISREQTRGKPEAIMDVDARAVIETMQEHDVQRLIHGHTHRPAIHDLIVSGKPAQRIVLGDWYEQGSVLECSPEGCQLQTISFLG